MYLESKREVQLLTSHVLVSVWIIWSSLVYYLASTTVYYLLQSFFRLIFILHRSLFTLGIESISPITSLLFSLPIREFQFFDVRAVSIFSLVQQSLAYRFSPSEFIGSIRLGAFVFITCIVSVLIFLYRPHRLLS